MDGWIWLLAALWIGACAGFAACALMQASRAADGRRPRPRPASSRRYESDYGNGLQVDTVTRF